MFVLHRVSVTFAAACFALFVLPWFFPSENVAAGESYALGFNNRIAVLGLLGVIAISVVSHLHPAATQLQSSSPLRWFREGSSAFLQSRPRPAMLITLAGAIGLAYATVTWDSMIAVPYWGEADYFHTRIDLIALGYRPYVDFQHNYGPLMLYAPLWLDWASEGSLGFETAYAWTVAAWTALGLMCQFFFLQRLRIPSWSMPFVAGAAILPWLPIHMGLNGTPLRFTLLPCIILGCDWAIHQPPAVAVPRFFPLALLALAGCGLGYLISPEIGLAATAASLAISWILLLRRDYSRSVACCCSAIAACLLIALLFPGYYHGLFGFAGGNANFPIYPNIHNILLAFIAPFAISQLLIAALRCPNDSNAPLAAAIASASAILLAPSLGRCDPGHIVYNSYMLFLLMLPATALCSRWLYKAWLFSFTLTCGVFIVLSYISYYAPVFQQAFAIADFYEKNPGVVMEWRDAWSSHKQMATRGSALNWKRTAPFPAWLREHAPNARSVSVPFGGDIGVDRFTKLLPGFTAPFHPCAKPEIHTPRDAVRAAADARTNEFAVVSRDVATAALSDNGIDVHGYERQISIFMSRLMLFPISARVVHAPFFPEVELCKLLLPAGDAVVENAGVVLLRMKPVDQKD